MGKLKTTKIVYGRAMVGTDAYKKNLSSKRSKRNDQKKNRNCCSVTIKTNLTWQEKLIQWLKKVECWFLDYIERIFD